MNRRIWNFYYFYFLNHSWRFPTEGLETSYRLRVVCETPRILKGFDDYDRLLCTTRGYTCTSNIVGVPTGLTLMCERHVFGERKCIRIVVFLSRYRLFGDTIRIKKTKLEMYSYTYRNWISNLLTTAKTQAFF